VSWAWWDWPLTWLTYRRPSVLWHCWLGHVTRKNVSKMSYVSSGTLNSTILYYTILYYTILYYTILYYTMLYYCRAGRRNVGQYEMRKSSRSWRSCCRAFNAVIQYCCQLLAKLFNICLSVGYVPNPFALSYTVPLLKRSITVSSRNLNVGDFRGISISPVMSKLFEHCLLHRFGYFFVTSDNLALNMDWAPRTPYTRRDV